MTGNIKDLQHSLLPHNVQTATTSGLMLALAELREMKADEILGFSSPDLVP